MTNRSAANHPQWNVWAYECALGLSREGAMVHFTGRGGTDVTYWFHRRGEDGRPIVYENGGIALDLVSGAALKAARRIGNRKNPG